MAIIGDPERAHIVVPAQLRVAVPAQLHSVSPARFHIIIPEELHSVNPASFHIVIPAIFRPETSLDADRLMRFSGPGRPFR